MHSLDKRWKELLFSFNSFGPNLMFVLIGAYLTDAINPIGLTASKESWSITGYCLVLPFMFGITWAIAKVIDGIVDIPLAHLTDNLRTRWGRRRPMFLIALVPMFLSFIGLWTPLQMREHSLLNTIWIGLMLVIFYSSYTLSMITFLGSSASVCSDEKQRTRVGSYKSFFDTIGYVIVYALLPIFIGKGINIRTICLVCAPLLLTVLIPIFMIKEGDKYGQGKDYLPEAKVPFRESLRITLSNRLFLRWAIPNACAYFGLNMFLAAQNALISGLMNLNAGYAAILNACAFAPVPIMLFIYYKMINKKGLRFAYRVALASFAVAILNFCVASEYIFPHNMTVRIIIGCIGGVCGSFGIGAFFASPFMVPAQIAAMELKVTGKDHTAMYFAIQSLIASIMAAVSTGLVYEQLKNIVTPKVIDGVAVAGEEWKVGASLIPVIVSLACVFGMIMAGKLPKSYTEEIVAEEMKAIENRRKK